MQNFKTKAFAVLAMVVMLVMSAGCVPPEEPLPIPEADQRHLVLMAGQSNMVDTDEAIVLSGLQARFPGDEIILVKYALGGSNIYQWGPDALYSILAGMVADAVGEEREMDTITLLWMQGESDASGFLYNDYEGELLALMERVRVDTETNELRFVMGRISDYGDGYPGWAVIRSVQESIADNDPLGVWLNTDDLNGPSDDLHYTPEGYAIFAQRLVDAAETVINL